MYAVTYAIPLITERDYDMGQLGNSYVFGAISIVRIVSIAVVARASKRANDRTLIAVLEGLNVVFLVAIVWPSDFTRHKIPMPLFVALAAGLLAVDPGPPVLSLYSKLIGQGNAGLYFSVLQSNGAVARAILGQLVGLAFGRLGPPSLWISCLILLACSCLIMVKLWDRFLPANIERMHAALEEDEFTPKVTSLERGENQFSKPGVREGDGGTPGDSGDADDPDEGSRVSGEVGRER
eukprot:FR742691.1.p1 GENE.FR742691.1~~FR742691.1.p1  ORF type:complete len:237 (+),score=18.43 FR742691.1:2-712(+)